MTRNSQNEAGFPLAPAGSSDASVVTGPLPGMMMLNVGDPLEVLPPEAREKVADLKRRREEFSVLYLADFENEQALRAEIFKHEARIEDLTKPRGLGGYDLDSDDIRVISEQKRLDQKRGDLARLLAAKDARGTESQRLGELLRNIGQALAARPGGCVAKMVVVDPPTVKGDIAATVEGRRRRGRELLADLEKVRAAPFPSTLARKKMRARIEQLAEAGCPAVAQTVDHDQPLGFKVRHDQVQILNGDPALIGFTETPDAMSLLAWLLKDELIRKLDAAIDEAADDGIAMTHEQRRQAEAQVLADLLATEREEVWLIEAAQAQGLQIDFRPETSALAILSIKWVAAPPPGPREGDGQAGVVRHIGG